jgi:hypothetical protein
MATILEFPPPRLRIANDGQMRVPAEIVIFPGVRIERSEFNLADRVPVARRNRKPEIRSRKSEIGSRKSEIGSRKSENADPSDF